VEQDETFSVALAKLLNIDPGPPVEVVNMGVAAYNTREEVALFMGRGAALDPDLIIVQYFVNDPDPDPFDPLHSYYRSSNWWTRSNLLRLVRKTWWRFEIWKRGNDFYVYLHRDERAWATVTDSLGQLSQWAGEREVPLILVIFPHLARGDWPLYPYLEIHRRVESAARSMGFSVMDLYPEFSGHPQDYLISKIDNYHPSPAAHEIAARELKKMIEW